MIEAPLHPADVVWIAFDPVRGREQGGHRPAVVVASPDFLAIVTTLVVVVPVTSTGRGWPNHVRLEGPSGLDRPSWAITEQPRAVSRDRVTGVAGSVSAECLAAIRLWLAQFLDL